MKKYYVGGNPGPLVDENNEIYNYIYCDDCYGVYDTYEKALEKFKELVKKTHDYNVIETPNPFIECWNKEEAIEADLFSNFGYYDDYDKEDNEYSPEIFWWRYEENTTKRTWEGTMLKNYWLFSIDNNGQIDYKPAQIYIREIDV